MAQQYIDYIKAKAHSFTATKSETPILSEEDEHFLNKIVSEENPPVLPPRPDSSLLSDPPQVKDAQIALMNGAQNIALPDTPQEVAEEPNMLEATNSTSNKPFSTWSWLRRDSRDSKRQTTAGDLAEIAQGVKDLDARPTEDSVVEAVEAKKEEEDMAVMLEKLNLAAVNNRVFSISDETQELLQSFNQVFKDLINGVPTAYDDLEKLLTNGDRQLQKTFNSLPAFLQKLIEKLPQTMTKGLAPEMMAAAAERASRSGVNTETAGKAAGAASKMGLKVPSLKDLAGKPAAMASMLRSIIAYLRARFPAFMGMNVLWSLAMFVLLFVFWYCHKRGKETRLAKERELTELEVENLDKEYRDAHPDGNFTTTAAEGAPIEDVKAGIEEVQEAKVVQEAARATEAESGPQAS